MCSQPRGTSCLMCVLTGSHIYCAHPKAGVCFSCGQKDPLIFPVFCQPIADVAGPIIVMAVGLSVWQSWNRPVLLI